MVNYHIYTVITGDRYTNTIFDTQGDDFIFGYAGNDTIYSSSGNDVIWAGKGDDDIYVVATGADIEVYGGKGTDTLHITLPEDGTPEDYQNIHFHGIEHIIMIG